MKISTRLLFSAASLALLAGAWQPAAAQTTTQEPAASEQAPAVEQAPAAATEQAPAVEQAPAAATEQAPAAVEQAPAAAAEQAPAAAEQAEQPVKKKKKQASDAEQAPAAATEQAPAAASEQAPAAASEQAPAATEQAPAAATEQAPAAAEQAEQPVKKKKKKEQASDAEQVPAAATEQAPAAAEQAPAAATGQAPAAAEQAPAAATGQAPADAATQPAVAEDPKPVFTAEKVLGDERPASELTDADLRERIQASEQMAVADETPKDQKRALRQKAKADSAELNARIAASTGVAVQDVDVSKQADKLLADTRQPADLADDELRERIKQSRAVLALEGGDEASVKQVRDRLTADTTEIRGRVATRERKQRTEQASDQDQDQDQGRANALPYAGKQQVTVADVVADDRPASDLTANAIEDRIGYTRRALRADGLPERDRRNLEDRLRDDRRALRDRFDNRRDRRRARLSDPAFGIAIAAGAVAGAIIASRPTIAVAEAYDEELEDWLIAPPLVKTSRRYKADDFRTQPRLRYSVPGVEVDNVRFGFGEAFLREEEIAKLDRVGEILERIVARNPDEVFLIEGHTDAVGTDAANLALSQQRAEAVRDALTEFFVIAPENLQVIGQGERYLKIPSDGPEVENRRVTIRRITPLLAGG